MGLEALAMRSLIVPPRKHEKTLHQDGILHCPAAKIKKYYNYSISQPISMGRLSQIRNFHRRNPYSQ
jgi:1,2-diacylglycerol 3-alpha-glucosyltransferase